MQARRSPDVLVIGAGIFGLGCAFACVRRGLRVTVLERGVPGSGASGGIVGALAPYGPEPWTAKKAFQARALARAGDDWAAVSAAAGIDAGFRRCGRLVPLADAAGWERAAAVPRHWPDGFGWRIVPPEHAPDWLLPAAAPEGTLYETLTGCVQPRRAVQALGAAVEALGGRVDRGCPVRSIADGRVETAGGTMAAQVIVLAAGVGTGALLAPLVDGAVVSGVKGQAALLAVPGAGARPLIAGGGLYIVPHGDGTVAVGSTDERSWRDPAATDTRLDAVIARARAVCPALAGAPVIARWAGLRPRAPRPDPLVGWIPGAAHVLVATGGYGIGFGIAHAVGDAIAELVGGGDPGLPAEFAPAAHGLTARRL